MKPVFDPSRFIVSLNKKLEKHAMGREAGVKQVALMISSAVIMRTPVMTGRARGNWFPAVNEPSGDVNDQAKQVERSGASNARVEGFVGKNDLAGNVFWLSNNLPYIGQLEWGGYPTYVKRGTWMGPGKGYEIRSAAGFSKQAPSGMVRVTLEEFMGSGIITSIIRREIAKEMRGG